MDSRSHQKKSLSILPMRSGPICQANAGIDAGPNDILRLADAGKDKVKNAGLLHLPSDSTKFTMEGLAFVCICPCRSLAMSADESQTFDESTRLAVALGSMKGSSSLEMIYMLSSSPQKVGLSETRGPVNNAAPVDTTFIPGVW